mmetsp:Transcript_12162/g.24721  ORF Transcript_12162/g.24721 Transcript_12162/m.24721 type:complete len:537 (-) Transcript_12162:25-1635(-)
MDRILFVLFVAFVILQQFVVRKGTKVLLRIQAKRLGGPCPSGASPKVRGHVDPGFEPMRESFQDLFNRNREVGAQIAVMWKGKLVVDLYAGEGLPNLAPWRYGSIDEESEHGYGTRLVRAVGEKAKYVFTSSDSILDKVKTLLGDCKSGSLGTCSAREEYVPMTGEMLIPLFSSSKVGESAVMAELERRGHLDLSEPIAKYWPEFAAGGGDSDELGKAHIKVSDLMRHQAGLVAPNSKLMIKDLADASAASSILEKQRPNWKFDRSNPDRQMYHPITRGLYASEICRRVDPKGRALGEFWREEVANKHNLQFYLGVNKEEWERSSVVKILNLPLLQLVKSIPQYIFGRLITREQRTRYLNAGNEFDTLLDFEAGIVAGFATKFLKGKGYLNFAAAGGVLGAVEKLNGIPSLNDPVLLSLPNLPSANGLANARSMAKLGHLILTGEVGGKNGMDVELPRIMDHGIGYDVSFTSAGYGHERFHVDGVHGWTGWAGIAGTILQWNAEKDLAFAYNTALPYGRVGKPRGIQLMKTLEKLV